MALRFFPLVGLALVLATVLAGGANPTAAQFPLQTFERDELTIETADGARHRFEVELALSREQQAQGLMYRRSLAENAGMLFVYGKEWPVSMWMKNTLIPLDMLFIRRDGRIVRIAERTVPRSLETISSGQLVAAVLEVNGGTAARLGIRPGDRVLHPAFDGGREETSRTPAQSDRAARGLKLESSAPGSSAIFSMLHQPSPAATGEGIWKYSRNGAP